MRFTARKWIRKPVLTPLNPVSVWEHTPLNPWRSEYPRFIRPPRDECRWEWAKLYDDGCIVAAGDEYLPSNVRGKLPDTAARSNDDNEQ